MIQKIDDIGFKLFFFLLTASTVLYIYSLNFSGINISIFRVLFLLLCLKYFKDLIFRKEKILKKHFFLIKIYFFVISINLFDYLRLNIGNTLGKDIINHIINFTLILLVVFYVNNEKRVNYVIKCYLLGSLIASYIAIFSWVQGHLPFEEIIRSNQSEIRESQQFTGYFNLVTRFTSSFTDPSFYGLYLCFVLCLCIYFFYFQNKNKFIVILFILNFLLLILTLSRTALAGFFMIIVVSIFFIKNFYKLVIYFFILFILIVAFFIYSYPELFELLIDVDIYKSLDSINARGDYWQNGINVFFSNPIIGGGTQKLSNDDFISSAHLVYLSLLAKYGILGFLLYFTFLVYPIYYAIGNRKLLDKKYVFLIVAIYSSILLMYTTYDFFQFLEFQYLIFGIVYAIIINRCGLNYQKKTFFKEENMLIEGNKL
jgi:O-antigen ligase